MSDAAKCSQCEIEIDDPGDDWDPETDVCLACGCAELLQQLDAARRERDELREALEMLIDEQNGPPLLLNRHRARWEAAMTAARNALRKATANG